MFNPVPAIALLPLALIWFGLGLPSLVFVIVHSVLWAVALNTLTGFRSVPETLRMSGRNYGLHGIRYVGLILIPAAFPSILAGLKIGWAFAWRTLIAAELVFGVSSRSGGLGWYIFEARAELETSRVFAGLLAVILIGLDGRGASSSASSRSKPCGAGACSARRHPCDHKHAMNSQEGTSGMRTLIKAQWIVANDGRGHTLLRDGVVVFEGKHIIHVGKTFDGPVDRTIDAGSQAGLSGLHRYPRSFRPSRLSPADHRHRPAALFRPAVSRDQCAEGRTCCFGRSPLPEARRHCA